MGWVIVVAVLAVIIGFLFWRRNQMQLLRQNPPQSYILTVNPDWSATSTGPRDRSYAVPTAVNLRDLGGYPTADGRRVRWGQVYRSGTLNELSDADVERVAALGIHMLCDFRTTDEAEASPELPDRLNARYLHLPLKADRDTLSRMIAALLSPAQLKTIMLRSYTDTIFENNADLYGQVLTLLTDPENLPLLFHCTAGKDRTGMFAALLLSLLGVPDEVIITDYTLSNAFHHRFRDYVGEAITPLKRFGFTVDNFYPLLIADGTMIRKVLETLRSRYGSVEAYALSKTGITADTLATLRQNLLEESV
jgi:protein-tyrosine phosphatase